MSSDPPRSSSAPDTMDLRPAGAGLEDASGEAMLIQKETVRVDVMNVQGQVLHGEVFVRPHGAAERGERLVDVLSQRWFVPLRLIAGKDATDSGKVTFLAVRHVAWVRLDLLSAVDELDPEAESDEHSSTARVVVELADGSRLEGAVRYALPRSLRRLGDYLEKLPAFFPLRTDDWIYLLSSSCVVSVTPLEEHR